MANLSRLIEQRNVIRRRGVEQGKAGNVFFHTFHDTEGGRCQYCWNSPGTGCAVVETWGASGSGGRMCCCSQTGVPSNSGAYSKKLVRVCGTSFICGWSGCSTEANGLCYSGRGNCSVACIFNSGDNGCVRAESGFGGYTNCTTSTPQWCCLAAVNFCRTNIGAGCGMICNIGGPNTSVQAAASSGDLNIGGGISCSMMCCCLNCACTSAPYQTMAISAGIFSATAPTCIAFSRSLQQATGNASNGYAELDTALSSFQGLVPLAYRCWHNMLPCGCYEKMGCYYSAPGVPGGNAWPCGDVRSGGMRGGMGAVRITFYS